MYTAHKRGCSAEKVWENLLALDALRSELKSQRPMVVPTMLKTVERLEEQMDFVDKCQKELGSYMVIEPTAAAGQWPDRAVVHMAPPVRTPCRRIDSRLTLLSDGLIVQCEEDFCGSHALGSGSLLEVWRGERMANLRKIHAEQRWMEHPLCVRCEEFHRP